MTRETLLFQVESALTVILYEYDCFYAIILSSRIFSIKSKTAIRFG